MRQPVLRQVANGDPCRHRDGARIGFIVAREHLEEGGLAGAVRTAQADTIAVIYLPGDVVEQYPVAERLREVGKLNQLGGNVQVSILTFLSQSRCRASGGLSRRSI